MEDDLYGDLDAGVASAEVARLRADLSRAEASAATADGELSRAEFHKGFKNYEPVREAISALVMSFQESSVK